MYVPKIKIIKTLYNFFWIMHPTRQLGALSKRYHSYCAVCNSVVPQPISLSIAFGKHENRNTLSLMGFRPAEKAASKTRIMTEKCWLHQQGFFYTIKLLSLLLYNNICFIHKRIFQVQQRSACCRRMPIANIRYNLHLFLFFSIKFFFHYSYSHILFNLIAKFGLDFCIVHYVRWRFKNRFPI